MRRRKRIIFHASFLLQLLFLVIKVSSPPVFWLAPKFESGEEFEALLEFQMPYLPDGTYFVAPSIIRGTQQNHVPLDWREEAIVVVVANSPVLSGKLGVAMESIELSAVSNSN